MTRQVRVRVQAALAAGQLTLDQWDVRRTEDNKVSVVDVIADVRAVGHDYAAQLYRRLLSEERVPQCEVRRLPPRAHSMASAENTLQRIGRGGARAAQETPVATAAEMVEIVWQLPGTAEFRRNCAQTVVRYLGGDETLVDEIRRNRTAQEELARSNPAHPARVFGEAVEAGSSTDTVADRAEKRRRMRAETDQLEIQNLHACAAALANIGESMDDAMLWSYRDRLSNLMRGGENVEQQDTIDAGRYLEHTRGMAAGLVAKLRILFGVIAARRLRERDGLPRDAPLPKARKRCNGSDVDVTIYKVPQDLGVLDAAYEELLGSGQFAAATANSRGRRAA